MYTHTMKTAITAVAIEIDFVCAPVYACRVFVYVRHCEILRNTLHQI